MGYKISYLEDQDASSYKRVLEEHEFEVTHCKPVKDFGETLKLIEANAPDLILMDFRLVESGGVFNAPPFAQYYRSQVLEEEGLCVPIVLLSNDKNINNYYKDFTSHDLFDFSINKTKFRLESQKYCDLMKSLIEGYSCIKNIQMQNRDLEELLQVPELVKYELDPRIFEQLSSKKNSTDIFMASTFILNQIVKPIGVLIGEDVLAARLGVCISSDDWVGVLSCFKDFFYTGIHSMPYNRWWSDGLDLWWEKEFSDSPSLKRLNSKERCDLIKAKLNLKCLKYSADIADSYPWTICKNTTQALDPVDGYEAKSDSNMSPWLDPEYLSYEAVLDLPDPSVLKELDLERFKDKAKGK